MKTSQKRSIAASRAPSRRSTAPNVSPASRAARCAARSDERNAQPVAQRQVPVRRASAGRRRLDRRRREPSSAMHGQREPRAQVRAALADALEEAEVLGEAAERDVLAVVRRRLGIAVALRQRLHRAAERRPRLVQRHVCARVHEVERGGEARRARRRRPRPSSRSEAPRATTASFAGVESRHDGAEDVEAVRLHAVELAAVEPANVATQSALRRSSESSSRSPSARCARARCAWNAISSLPLRA